MKTQQTDFDEIIDRNKVATLKFDSATMLQIFGAGNLWPGWVADMDFKAAPEIIDTLSQRLNHAVFGYEASNSELTNAVSQWYQRRYDWNFTTSEPRLV